MKFDELKEALKTLKKEFLKGFMYGKKQKINIL